MDIKNNARISAMLKPDFSKSIEACAAHYGEEADEVRDYMYAGLERAIALDNRGPIRFEADGSLHGDIRAAYSKYGFYVFEGVEIRWREI